MNNNNNNENQKNTFKNNVQNLNNNKVPNLLKEVPYTIGKI